MSKASYSRKGLVSVVASASLVLTACAAGGSSEPQTVTVTEKETASASSSSLAESEAQSEPAVESSVVPAETSESQAGEVGQRLPTPPTLSTEMKRRMAFEKVLANPGIYPANPAAKYTPTGHYSYALVEATGDDQYDILLKIEGVEFSPVLLVTVDDNGEIVVSTDNLIMGADETEQNAYLVGSGAGKGIYQIDASEIGGESTATLYTPVGTKLEKVGSPQPFTYEEVGNGEYHNLLWRSTTSPDLL